MEEKTTGMGQTPETELVLLAMEGNEKAFVELYSLYYKKLYRYAAYNLRSTYDAEDAVSETVADAYGSIRKLKHPEAFGMWIFQILANKCKAKMRDYYIAADEEVPEGSVEEDFALNLQVKQLFMQLPKKERMIVGLSVFGGYDSKEIGTILHMKDSTVRSIRKRTLDKMAACMNN